MYEKLEASTEQGASKVIFIGREGLKKENVLLGKVTNGIEGPMFIPVTSVTVSKLVINGCKEPLKPNDDEFVMLAKNSFFVKVSLDTVI